MLVSNLIDPNTRLVFLHIPKTAGSSIITLFQSVLGHDAVWCHGQNFDVSQLTRDIPQHIRVICGHFTFSRVNPLLPKDFHYLSVIRDPLDRIVSYHEFVVSNAGHPDQAFLHSSDINVNVEQCEFFRSSMQNQQARFLSPDGAAASVRKLVERGILSLATINEVAGQFMRVIFDRAKIPSSEPGRVNVSEREKPNLNPKSRQLLEALTDQDRALFSYVSGTEGRIESFG